MSPKNRQYHSALTSVFNKYYLRLRVFDENHSFWVDEIERNTCNCRRTVYKCDGSDHIFCYSRFNFRIRTLIRSHTHIWIKAKCCWRCVFKSTKIIYFFMNTARISIKSSTTVPTTQKHTYSHTHTHIFKISETI